MISTSQLICILLLSRLSAEIAYPSVGGYGWSTLAAAAAAEGTRFVLALPFLLYSIRGKSFYAAVTRKSRIAGWIFALSAGFLLALAAARSALFTAEFAQRTVLAGMSGAVIAILIGIFAVYCAAKGAEAISRSGVLILAGTVLLTVVAVLASIPHMRGLQLPAVQTDSSFFEQIYERVYRGGEYLAFAALLPYVRREEKSLSPFGGAVCFAVIAFAGVILINVFTMAVLGEFYNVADFPFTAAAQLSDIALFKRLDGFAGALWSAAAALRCGLLLFSVYSVIYAVVTAKKGAGHERKTHSGSAGGHSAAQRLR